MKLDRDEARCWCERLARPYRHPASGAIAAIVTAGDAICQGFGRIDAARPGPPGAKTLFEIGSITKVFTAILLARLSLAGRIDMHAPIGTIVRDLEGTPEWITPRSLSTHTSGLPRIPVPLWRALFMDVTDPYARFSAADLISWMGRWRPSRRPRPDRASYSNLGVGLLGYVLGEVAGGGYESALRREVLDPLGLRDTAASLEARQLERFATPHRSNGRPTPPWSFDALAGAGALRSTASDLLSFAQSVMAAPRGIGTLHEAIAATLAPQIVEPGRHAARQCLGWVRVQLAPGDPPVWAHDGGTLGSSSTLLVAPDPGVAVLALANIGQSLMREIRIVRSQPAKLVAEICAAVAPARS
jgi:CubicO group peptidase (beta-lactamase class C family)